MRANARIGNKQPLVHYAGETFMKPFCSYLGLEEQRRSSHHIQNILHPLIFLFVHKLRVFYKVLKNIFRRWLFLFFLPLSENAVKLRELTLKDRVVKKRYLSAFLAKLPLTDIQTFQLLVIKFKSCRFIIKTLSQKLAEIEINFFGESSQNTPRLNPVFFSKFPVIADKIVNPSGKFNHIVNPSFISAHLFANPVNKPFIGQGLAAKVPMPRILEKHIILEKPYVPQNMVEDHNIRPIGVVIVVVRYGRSSVNNGLIRIVRNDFVKPFISDNFYIINPVVVKSRNHYFGTKFKHVLIGNDILKRFSLNIQANSFGSFFTFFHYFLSSLVYQFHFALPRFQRTFTTTLQNLSINTSNKKRTLLSATNIFNPARPAP